MPNKTGNERKDVRTTMPESFIRFHIEDGVSIPVNGYTLVELAKCLDVDPSQVTGWKA